MHRFLSSAASSSSGRAEPPSSPGSAEQFATSLRSAEQPATPSQLKIASIRDVQRWLAQKSIVSCSSADMQRIREAVAVLSHSKPRKEDVRPLQSKWLVAFKKDKKSTKQIEINVSNQNGNALKTGTLVLQTPFQIIQNLKLYYHYH